MIYIYTYISNIRYYTPSWGMVGLCHCDSPTFTEKVPRSSAHPCHDARYRELFLVECPGSFLSFAEAQEAHRRKSVGSFHGKNHGKIHLRMEVFMGKSSKPMGKMPLPCLTIRLNQEFENGQDLSILVGS